MQTSHRGIRLIKRFEGFEPRVYLDAVGIPTIGYGHVVLPGETFTSLTDDQATELLMRDLIKFERSVLKLIAVDLTQNEFDALVSFTFNLGPGALQRSSLRAKLNREERDDAADEFLKWVYAGGRKLKGLVLRREAERELFLRDA